MCPDAWLIAGGTLSDDDLVAELLVNFELKAAGNVSAINKNTRGHTAVVMISSQHMRKLYKRFPEIMLVDCTHKINRCVRKAIMFLPFIPCFRYASNISPCFAHVSGAHCRYNYQFRTLMVMDQLGNGQAVQHSVIERNADWHIVKVVEQF